MTNNGSNGSGPFEHIFERQLVEFDESLVGLRENYHGHSIEERQQLRLWLEKVAALQDEGYNWNLNLQVHAQNEIVDENGDPLHVGDMVSSPLTMLKAVKAWDDGEPFAPDGILP